MTPREKIPYSIAPGEMVRAVVEVGALSLDSGLVSIFPECMLGCWSLTTSQYGHVRIVELHPFACRFRRQDPLTPINETVEETLDAPNIEEHEDIRMGVLVEGIEDAKDHTNSNIVNRDPDFEEFTLISNSVAELVNEGEAAASITGMLFPCPITACRLHCHRRQGHKAQGRSHRGRRKEETKDSLNLCSC
jgi:hypothetical protein